MNIKELLIELNSMLDAACDAQKKSQSANEAVYHRAEKETLMKIISMVRGEIK